MTTKDHKEFRTKAKKERAKSKATTKGLNREDRYFKSVLINKDKEVEAIFTQKVVMGTNSETGKEIVRHMPISVDCPYAANKDLIAAMKATTRHALNLAGFDEASIQDTTVTKLEVTGEVENHNARAILHLTKELPWSNKPLKIKVPQVMLFDQITYKKTAELVKAIELVIEEVWNYAAGKNDMKEQLSIFND